MHRIDSCLKFGALLLLALNAIANAQPRVAPFPPIGGSQTQAVRVHVIGLGGNGSVCRANVGFRSVPAGDALGPPESVVLRQGDSQTVTFSLFSLRLAVGEHADVQPVVELADNNCFASVELSGASSTQSAV